MAKGKSKLGSKNFFTITVLSVTAFMLIVFTFALQKPTNTQSDASELAARCRTWPTLTSAGTNSGDDYVTYIYKVGHPSGGCKMIDYGLSMKVPSSRWDVEYKLNSNSWKSFIPFISRYDLKSGMTDTVRVRVSPPPGIESNTYSLKAKVCALYYGEVGSPYLSTNPDECITRNATYTVD